jgi:putative ABC transport system substrate-binding protein
MKRREFIARLGGAAVAWPLAARAQHDGGVPRIGYLALTSASFHKPYVDAFRRGLQELGYIEGKNLEIEVRYADGDTDRLPGLVAELLGLNVKVLVTYATGVAVAQRATSTIPIVMASQGDAVASGLVASLKRPGGNVTGSTFFNPQVMAKRAELLKEAVPSLSRAGVLLKGGSQTNGLILAEMGLTAKALALELQTFEMGTPQELTTFFRTWADNQIGGLVVDDQSILLLNMTTIVSLAAKYRIPSIGPVELARRNGLLAYGVDFFDQFHRAATFVDKILKGAKAGDIPVEQATKFITLANMKTAKALGIELPISILLQAEVIE